MGMVGLRDLVVVTPAASFHHQQVDQPSILSDHHHHYHHLHQAINNSNTSLGVGVGVGVGVFPILTAPCLPPNIVEDNETANNNNNNSRRGIQLWQQPSMVGSGASTGAGSGVALGFSSSGVIGGTTCQDCGNQAKKDCSHRRCRTCCKSRGFECSTHVKSTWVPAERRRERQIVAATTASSASTSSAKKARVIPSQTTTTSTSNNTPARSFDTSSSHQDASFKENLPGQVRAPAFFKCVRVTSLEDGDAEYAYQAVVKIGGHVFKGLLQDHGIEGRVGIPNISELQLGGGAGDSGGSGVRNVTTSSMLEPSNVYAVSSSGMLGGTNFSNPIS